MSKNELQSELRMWPKSGAHRAVGPRRTPSLFGDSHGALERLLPVGPVCETGLARHPLVVRLVEEHVRPGGVAVGPRHVGLVVDQDGAHDVRLVARDDHAVDPVGPEGREQEVVLLARARPRAHGVGRRHELHVDPAGHHLPQRLDSPGEGLERGVEAGLRDHVEDRVLQVGGEVGLDLKVLPLAHHLAERLALVDGRASLDAVALDEHGVPVDDGVVHVDEHCHAAQRRAPPRAALELRDLAAQVVELLDQVVALRLGELEVLAQLNPTGRIDVLRGGAREGERLLGREVLLRHGLDGGLAVEVVDDLVVVAHHDVVAELPQHALPAGLAELGAERGVLVDLEDGLAERVGVAGGHEEALHAVLEGLGDSVDGAAHDGALEGHSLADDEGQHLVERGHDDDVGGHVELEHVRLDVHDGDAGLAVVLLGGILPAHVVEAGRGDGLLDLLDVLDLVVADVAGADHEALKVGAAHVLDEVGDALGRVDLALAVADGAEVQHDEVVLVVAERLADLVAVVLGAERVELLQGDAVVDRDGCIGAEHAFVDRLLHVRGEDDAAAVAERLLDVRCLKVLHHEHLLGIVVELVLGPGLVDHPHGAEPHAGREVDDVAAHDGVGKDDRDLLLLETLLENRQEIGAGRVEDLDAQPELLEVLAHRALLGREDDAEGLLGHELGDEVEAEVICSVSLERVHEHGDARLGHHELGLLLEALGLEDLVALLVEQLEQLVKRRLRLRARREQVGRPEPSLGHRAQHGHGRVEG
mmetsp:Transcript_49605/g.121040  ORF Transcript_49605/g.121040 Transcript_49605/m.121040 type:complete len:760 (+) Transcript_49605:170-2449(+)